MKKLKYIIVGILCFVLLVFLFVGISIVANSPPWPMVDNSNVLIGDPRYDPNDICTAEESKVKWFYSLPEDINMLKIVRGDPFSERFPEEVLFEYNSPDLHSELDKILKFRDINKLLLSIKGGPRSIRIHFFQGNELCETKWDYHNGSTGNFFPHGLLTWESKNRLHRWFVGKGFHGFNEMRENYNRENANMVMH